MLSARPLGIAFLVGAIALPSCNDSPTETQGVGAPAALDIVAGDAQEGVVGTELANPLVVRVEDANGLPVVGQLVNFRVTAGGGSVFAGSAITNALGIVQDRWTLGTSTADSQRVEARAVDPNTGARIVFATFRATARAGPGNSLTKVGGDAQQGMLGAPLAESLAVRVADAYGNPVSDANVTWTASFNSGSVSPASSRSNAQGVAKTAWTLGSRLDLSHTVVALVAPTATATFNATASLPPTATIVKVVGDGASATVGSAMAESLAVRVQLAGGQPVAGVTVMWAVVAGGGSVSPESSVTGENGIARALLTPGTTPRVNTITASVTNLTPATITVTAQPDVPASLTKVSGDDQSAAAGQRLSSPLVVRVTDRFGNELAGVTVAWEVTSGGGSVTPPTSTTDASGRASAQWTVGSAGTQSLSASVNGVTPVSFSARAFGPASPVRSVAPGNRHTCAISEDGTTYCWGANEDGQLGDGTTTMRATATAVSGSPQFSAVAAGGSHTCALTQDGAAYCWGLNDHGQLGDGTTTRRLVPTPVTGPVRFVALTLGYRHTCGLISTGIAYCWGYNAEGEVGDGTSDDRLVPTPVTTSIAFSSITSGFWFTCGLSGSSIYCWGKNIVGQIGDGTTTNRHTPTPILNRGQAFTFVEAGGNHGCALAGGAAYCWGHGSFGEDGGSSAAEGVPVQVEGNVSFASLSAGDAFTCGVTTAGATLCWGINHVGELGRGTTNTSENPTPGTVSGGLQFMSHAAGIGRYSCGRAAPSSGLYCWGMNLDGQLGDGTTVHRSAPWPVVIP